MSITVRFDTPSVRQKYGKRLAGWAALTVTLMLGACGIGADTQDVVIAEQAGSAGRGAFSDEPRSVFVATEILTTGGSAVDATVAMFMTMTVTLPSSVSLAGGGSCLVSNLASGVTEVIDFPLRSSVSSAQGEDNESVAAAVPAGLRGMLLLHARHGREPIGNLILPAERLARNGTTVSRALADDLAAGGSRLLDDPMARRLFLRGDGALLQAGNQIVMPTYADTLRMVRGGLSGAPRIRRVLNDVGAAATRVGARADTQVIEAYRASSRPAPTIPVAGWGFATNRLAIAATDERDAAVATAAVRFLAHENIFAGADPLTKPHALADGFAAAGSFVAANGPITPSEGETDAAMAAYRETARRFGSQPFERLSGVGRVPGAAVFGAIDRESQNVVCAVGMGAPFGLGRIDPETGILVAAEPSAPGDPGWTERPTALGALVFNENSGALFSLAGVSGGPGAIAVASELMLNIIDGADAADAIAAPRVIPGPTADRMALEEGTDVAVVDHLNRLGYAITPRADFARAHAVVCPGGLRITAGACNTKSDPRGHGAMLGGG